MQEDNQALDELVVVGYGTMKKSDLTGSVSSLSTEDVTAKGAATVMEGLQVPFLVSTYKELNRRRRRL